MCRCTSQISQALQMLVLLWWDYGSKEPPWCCGEHVNNLWSIVGKKYISVSQEISNWWQRTPAIWADMASAVKNTYKRLELRLVIITRYCLSSIARADGHIRLMATNSSAIGAGTSCIFCFRLTYIPSWVHERHFFSCVARRLRPIKMRPWFIMNSRFSWADCQYRAMWNV